MIPAEKYIKEEERLFDLRSYSILDTLRDLDHDNLTVLAAEICETPISLISLVDEDRQWFKSRNGIKFTQTPRDHAFCAHAINDPENIFIVPDARTDERFFDNPIVTGEPYVVFYAGMPLVSDAGMPFGTICVIDHEPRMLTDRQIELLSILSNQVMNLFRLRKNQVLLGNSLKLIEDKNNELEKFAYTAAHDMKSPLNNISNQSELFLLKYGAILDNDGRNILGNIKRAVLKLQNLIDGLLEYYKADKSIKEIKSRVNLEVLKNDIINLLSVSEKYTITLKSRQEEIVVNKPAIEQILLNLLDNSIKYNDKSEVKIEIGVNESDTYYEIYVKDNGCGIAPSDHKRIFEVFNVLQTNYQLRQRGSGIGLATVKKIVKKLGGKIKVESDIGEGTKILFTIKK